MQKISYELHSYENDYIVFNTSLFKEFPLELFDTDFLRKFHSDNYTRIESDSTYGRDGVHLFSYAGEDLVLRHYYRGGQIAKFSKDSYIWNRLDNTRAILEFKLLCYLYENGLPVPQPIAARIHRKGLFYSADLITQRIPDTNTLSSILKEKELSGELWMKIGTVIKQMHAIKCNHADLNAHNILINGHGEIYLIDFDKSKTEIEKGAWCDENLKRLKRSLIKLSNLFEQFAYSDNNFENILKGYNQA